MGYLYGYYSEDPNFPDGVRVNVEAIYEPPQMGGSDGVTPLEDPFRSKVDIIAEGLSLERVGHIFTTLNKDKVFMTANQLRECAAHQQEHVVNHPDGMKVSKYVTVVVEKKSEEEIGVECYMASDQCQTLERDQVLGNSENPKKMCIREPAADEAMPAVLREGAPVKEFEPDFFLVSLAHGQPNDNNTQFNILKRYDFPVMHRFGKK
jgi:nuclear protein localization family protein 4